MLVVAETGADDIGRSGREGGVAEIVILVFGLGGPIRREHVFEAAADGVAVLAVAVGGEAHRHAGHRHADIIVVAPGVTALGVQQRRAPSVAEPAGYRTDLIVVVDGHQRTTGEQHAVIVAAAQPGILRFSANYPIGRELIVEAGLYAAEEAGVVAPQAVIAGKGAADMAADIETRPVIDHGRRGV